jgi:hypothetical protein
MSDARIVAFYEWALRDALAEAQGDFPLLRSIRNPVSWPLTERFAPTHTAAEVADLVRSMVRGSHQAALSLLDESFTDGERDRVQQLNLAMALGAPEYEESIAREIMGKTPLHKDGPLLRASLKRLHAAVPGSEQSQGAVRHPLNERWDVVTDVRTIKRGRVHLFFTHTLVPTGVRHFASVETLDHRVTNVMHWSGLRPGYWEVPCLEDIPPVAEDLIRASERFLLGATVALSAV